MNRVIKNKKEIYIDLSLFINKIMFDDKFITYDLYREVQDYIMKENFL